MFTLINFYKIIKLNLIFYFLSLLIIYSTSVFSHEIKPSIIDYKIEENNILLNIRLNAELILSDIDASKITDTNSSSFSDIYDSLRLLTEDKLRELFIESWTDIQSKINFNINDETRKLEFLDLVIETNNNSEISRESLVYLKFSINEDAEFFTFK